MVYVPPPNTMCMISAESIDTCCRHMDPVPCNTFYWILEVKYLLSSAIYFLVGSLCKQDHFPCSDVHLVSSAPVRDNYVVFTYVRLHRFNQPVWVKPLVRRFLIGNPKNKRFCVWLLAVNDSSQSSISTAMWASLCKLPTLPAPQWHASIHRHSLIHTK